MAAHISPLLHQVAPTLSQFVIFEVEYRSGEAIEEKDIYIIPDEEFTGGREMDGPTVGKEDCKTLLHPTTAPTRPAAACTRHCHKQAIVECGHCSRRSSI